MIPTLVPLAAIVFAGYTVQTVSGFGAVVVIATLGAHLAPVDVLLGLVLPLSVAQCSYILARHHHLVHWRLLRRWILPLMGAGLIGGMLLRGAIDEGLLQPVLAVSVLLLAGRELWVRLGRSAEQPQPLPDLARAGSLVTAGVMHGLYAIGGPLLVYGLGRSGLSKGAFRSTLAVVWVAFNLVLLGDFARAGLLTRDTAWMLPSIAAGLWLGEQVHARVDQRRFELGVYVFLAAAAGSLLVP